MKIKYYLKEMRLHHYIKNLLVFVPLICSKQFFQTDKLINSIYAFLSFCFISSAIYFINDIRDIENDKKHPTKCKRPIASGQIGIKSAIMFAVLLIVISIIFSALCFNLYAFILMLLYFILNIGYSFGLKKIPLLDISILVSGFLIRVLYGSFVTDIQISNWLYLVVISAAFYLGLGKRKSELEKYGNDNTRQVIKKYSLSFLENNMYMCMALIIVFYALWTVDKNTIAMHNSNLIWTVPVVMLIFMRYGLTAEKKADGDPVEVLIHDKTLLCLCILYLILMIFLIYI